MPGKVPAMRRRRSLYAVGSSAVYAKNDGRE